VLYRAERAEAAALFQCIPDEVFPQLDAFTSLCVGAVCTPIAGGGKP